ncbi:hypothetical protein BCR42DRAFT_401487 [Absidia repens]|uniref:TOG domain-containing protein n=1 Tax=Absidia repens TaxID=90262 RepID=A0A1X2J2N5_9FUNG|nr:hypothetical protein BCR42DRAFT_401487 [Absidia repens]
MTISPLAYEVAHCSSWDEDRSPEQLVHSSPGNRSSDTPHLSPEEELRTVKFKGWQTPKCPTYPQDLIIHLLCGPARIAKIQLLSHHYKIATKIDIYIGLLKESSENLSQQSDDDDDTLIEFTRLGYICFDNNARTQFRARELKSIKINADGEYIRLVVRNNHQNRLNIYNQVGLLALNVLGQPLMHNMNSSLSQNHMAQHLHTSLDDSSMLSSSTRRTSVSSNHSMAHELSTSGVVELELQHWTSSLVHAESLAVRDEAYQTAKTYKFISDRLSRFSKILAEFEQAKRHAVDTKDYDEAEKIKGDINEIKQAAEAIIKQANIRITNDGQVVPLNDDQPTNLRADMAPEQQDDSGPVILQDEMYDEAIAKWTNFDATKSCTLEAPDETPAAPHVLAPSTSTTSSPHAIPILSSSMSAKIERRKSMVSEDSAAAKQPAAGTMPALDEEEEESEIPLDPDAIPEPIMDEERDAYQVTIIVFGEEIVACVLSIKSKCRERGLLHIQHCIDSACRLASTQALDQLTQLFNSPISNDDEEDSQYDRSSYLVNAALMMIQEAIMDSREPIVTLAIQIWQQLNDFYLTAKVDPQSTTEWMHRAFSGLIKRTGDNHSIIRSNAVDLVLVLSHTHHKAVALRDGYSLLDQFICKPERIIHNHKEALARINLVQRALDELKLEDQEGIIALGQLMAFVMAYIYHNHGEVQQESMRLLLLIGTLVEWKQLSPFLDDETRRSLQPKLQTKSEAPVSHLLPNKDNAMAELRALTVQAGTEKKQVVRKSDISSTKRRPVATAEKKKTQATNGKRTQRTTTSSRPATTTTKTSAPAEKIQDTADSTENTMCIFCDEHNEKFNEQTLITHYYKTCPALTNCPNCQIIVEVSTLQTHILTDCDKRHLMKQCTRCKQPVPVEQWLQHTLKNACTAYTNPDEVRCPLCFVAIEPGTDEGWRLHLLTGDGCPKNQRRQQQHRDTTNTTTTTTVTKKPSKKPSSEKKQTTSSRTKPSSLRKKITS